MTQAASAVVRRQIVVEAPTEKAFAVFTERLGDFKPPEHNLLSAPLAETVFEPRVGGHIFDRAVDGTECRLGPCPRLRAADPRRFQLGHRSDLAAGDQPGERGSRLSSARAARPGLGDPQRIRA
jgi:hypothetical protein